AFTVPENLDLARAFEAPMILNSPLIENSFRKAAYKKGKHILVYEAGESLRFSEFAIQEGIDGTLRLMKYLNMIDVAPEPKEETKIYLKSDWLRAKYAGLFSSTVKLGEEIK